MGRVERRTSSRGNVVQLVERDCTRAHVVGTMRTVMRTEVGEAMLQRTYTQGAHGECAPDVRLPANARKKHAVRCWADAGLFEIRGCNFVPKRVLTKIHRGRRGQRHSLDTSIVWRALVGQPVHTKVARQSVIARHSTKLAFTEPEGECVRRGDPQKPQRSSKAAAAPPEGNATRVTPVPALLPAGGLRGYV